MRKVKQTIGTQLWEWCTPQCLWCERAAIRPGEATKTWSSMGRGVVLHSGGSTAAERGCDGAMEHEHNVSGPRILSMAASHLLRGAMLAAPSLGRLLTSTSSKVRSVGALSWDGATTIAGNTKQHLGDIMLSCFEIRRI